MFSIQNLQNKSLIERKIILFIIVGILMFFVVGIWYFQFKESLRKKEFNNDSLTPVSELSKSVGNIYEKSFDKIDEVKEIIKFPEKQ